MNKGFAFDVIRVNWQQYFSVMLQAFHSIAICLIKKYFANYQIDYRLVRKSNHPFLVLKGVTEMSFLVLKRVSVNSEEN
jgi:hypothetical protein